MKNLFLTTILTISICVFGFAQNISGSAHDFSGHGWNTGGELCEVCHTPHNAVTGLTAQIGRASCRERVFRAV